MDGVTLVTGGRGFIGSHVVDLLADAGKQVRVLDWLHPQAHAVDPGNRVDGVEYVHGDVRRSDVVDDLLGDVVAVYHAAAMVGLGMGFADVADYVGHNDLGTAVLLRGLDRARFTGRLVLASSVVVYGESPGRCPEHGVQPPRPRPQAALELGRFDHACATCGRTLEPVAVDERSPIDPRSVYAATKLHQEHLCTCFGRETGARVAMLRYHNVYGPRMPRDTPYAGVAAIFRSSLEAGRPPVVFEDGRQLRDFVHVHDVAQATVLALDPAAPDGAFNVASGAPATIGEMAAELCQAFGGALEPVIEPRYRLGDVRHVVASPQRAMDELGYRPAWTFSAGMHDFATASLRPAGDAVAQRA